MLAQGLWLGSAALLLLVAAGWLWRRGTRQQMQAALAAQLTQTLQQREQVAAAATTAPPPGGRARERSWDLLWTRAGLQVNNARLVLWAGLLLGAAALVWLWVGIIAAIGGLVLCLAGLSFLLWLRIEKRRQRMAAQLPGMLEGMVRLITIGNSMAMAFQASAVSVEMPLREALDRVSALSRSGQNLDDAMRQVARQFDLEPLALAASVVGVALRFGGRSDQVLERLAAFMRDLEQARMEMSAMSAELRLSAWILGLLPVSLAGFILLMNNSLFMNMWHDALGFKMLLGAAVMQIIGVVWLYRLAKSV